MDKSISVEPVKNNVALEPVKNSANCMTVKIETLVYFAAPIQGVIERNEVG